MFLTTTNSDSPSKIGKIVFDSQKVSNNDIWVMYSDGSGLKRLTTHYEVDWDPAWSPDGMKIAFVSDRSGSNDIWIMDYNGSNPVELVKKAANPEWSPQNSKILFFDSKVTGRAQIWKTSIN